VDTLDYKSSQQAATIRWWIRYAIFVPAIAFGYSALLYVYAFYFVDWMNTNVRLGVSYAAKFPMFFIFHGYSNGGTIFLVAINGLFWGFFLTALWHCASVVRRHRLGHG
jgi:hypothetical protein